MMSFSDAGIGTGICDGKRRRAGARERVEGGSLLPGFGASFLIHLRMFQRGIGEMAGRPSWSVAPPGLPARSAPMLPGIWIRPLTANPASAERNTSARLRNGEVLAAGHMLAADHHGRVTRNQDPDSLGARAEPPAGCSAASAFPI